MRAFMVAASSSYFFGHLHRRLRVERREFGVRAVAQGNEAQFAQLLFLKIGDHHVGGTLRGHAVLVGGEAVDRQAGTSPPLHHVAFDAANAGQPTGLGEGPDHHGPEGVGRIAPQISVLVGAGNVLAKTESIHPRTVILIGQPHQDAGQRQARRIAHPRSGEMPSISGIRAGRTFWRGSAVVPGRRTG